LLLPGVIGVSGILTLGEQLPRAGTYCDWKFINKTDICYRNFQFDGPNWLAYGSSFMTTRHHHHHHHAHSATAGV